MSENELCREAAKTAIEKHRNIITQLEAIVTLNYSEFKVVNTNTGDDLEDLRTMDFALENIQKKTAIIKGEHKDIETCYKQMGVFK